jgi:hypothetical protein
MNADCMHCSNAVQPVAASLVNSEVVDFTEYKRVVLC